ncbi:Glyoxalase-like domain protein [compost metagenome]
MLLTESHFKTFIKKEIADATKTTEVIVSLNVDTKEHVDEMVKRALDAGATHSIEPVDHGFMYIWGFQDLDGHLWELCYLAEEEVGDAIQS